MSSDMQIVSVAGGYWTGSSTVVDLLAEHEDCAVVPYEFMLFSFGQFFEEVFEPLCSARVDERLLARHIARLNAYNKSDLYPLRAIGRKMLGAFNLFPRLFFERQAGMKRSLGPQYDRETRQLIAALKDVLSGNIDVENVRTCVANILTAAVHGVLRENKTPAAGVFDQLIAPPYTESASSALENLRYINIDRDWRDQYISLRNMYKPMMARNRALGLRPWAEDLRVVDEDPVRFFLRLRAKVDAVRKLQLAQRRTDMLWLRYEDVVLDRDATAAKIFEFLDLDPARWTPDRHLHPEASMKRIGKWKRPPWTEEPLASEFELLYTYLGDPREPWDGSSRG